MNSKFNRVEKRIAGEMAAQGIDVNDFGSGEREFRNRVLAAQTREDAKYFFKAQKQAAPKVGGFRL